MILVGKIGGKILVSNAVSKRVFATLPDSIFDELEFWAREQGRPTANLAAFLIEASIKQAKKSGEFPESEYLKYKNKTK